MEKLLQLLTAKNILVWFACEAGTISGIQNGVLVTLSKDMICRSTPFSKFRFISCSDDAKVIYSSVDMESEQFRFFLFYIFPQEHRLQFFNTESTLFTMPEEELRKFKEHAETIREMENEINNPKTSKEKIELLKYGCMLKKMDRVVDYVRAYGYAHSRQKVDPSCFEIFHKFIDLVEEHCRKEHHVVFYATQLNISIHHLVDQVKKITGKTPTQWINSVLVSKIEVDLILNNSSISQLVEGYNFSDSAVLYSFFKRETGYSPQQYKMKFLKGE